jgi:hypothetical protein
VWNFDTHTHELLTEDFVFSARGAGIVQSIAGLALRTLIDYGLFCQGVKGMPRFGFRLGSAIVATAMLIGCGEGENPAPTTDESSPTAGMDSLELMKKGGTGPTTGIQNAKEAAKAEKAKAK